MTHTEFEVILYKRLEAIKTTLFDKGKEYVNSKDRLHNFKEAAKLLRYQPKEVVLAYFSKHIISIVDMVKSTSLLSEPLIDEKIGDAINYLILLEAVLKEKRQVVVNREVTAIQKEQENILKAELERAEAFAIDAYDLAHAHKEEESFNARTFNEEQEHAWDKRIQDQAEAVVEAFAKEIGVKVPQI